MSFEINKQNLDYTHTSRSKVRYISDCDIIVPDTKPDIKYILEVCAAGQINEKLISDDGITVSGNVNYNILYVSDSDTSEIECINYTAPFSHRISADCRGENVMLSVTGEPVHTEYSVHNSRKLNARCAIDFVAVIYKQNQTTLATSVSDKDIAPHRIKSLAGFNMLCINEQTFHIDEILGLPDHAPKISRLVKSTLRISDSELKTVSNKVVIKCNVGVRILYICDDELCSWEGEIPFTRIVDAPAASSECESEVAFCIKNINVSSELGPDATMSQVKVEADVCADISYFDETTLDYVSDIYSPDYEIEVENETVKLSQIADKMNTQCIVSNTVKPGGGHVVSKIYAMDTAASIEDVVVDDTYISVSGSLSTDIIYGAEDGSVQSVSEKLPFECNLSTDRKFSKGNTRLDANVVAEHSSYSIEGGGGINVRGVLRINGTLISENSVVTVKDVKFDENKKIDKSGQAGITVYFVQSGDTLWDIAKRYHTTESEISTVNKLEKESEIFTGQQLLIPKR